MLTRHQRSSVVRALTVAYWRNRDLSLLQVCKKNKIWLYQQEDDAYGGSQVTLNDEKYSCQIEIPKRAPVDYKEHVFWHEFSHIWLEKLHIFSRRIGWQGHLQQFDEEGDYWVHERLCEAFADAMMLYRRGLVEKPSPTLEAFLFADEHSIGYAEVAGHSVKRVEKFCAESRSAQRNIDLHSLEDALAHQRRYIANSPFQQQLPMVLMDHHQSPGIRWFNEQEDLEYRLQFCKRQSWKRVWPEEEKVLAEIKSLQYIKEHEQLALFEEVARSDRSLFEVRLKRLEKSIAKFQT